MSPRTVTMSEAKTHFSRITAAINESGESVTVFRNSKPWVEIRPLAAKAKGSDGASLPAETREALDQAETLLRDPEDASFTSLDDLFDDLGI